jgi:hypothetical protein
VYGLFLCLGVATEEGLAGWAAGAFGLKFVFLHMSCGFLAALAMAWRMGSRKMWKGLLGVAIAIAAGGVGEACQHFTLTRGGRFSHFLLTAAGCCVAVVPYLLALGARMCEEPLKTQS